MKSLEKDGYKVIGDYLIARDGIELLSKLNHMPVAYRSTIVIQQQAVEVPQLGGETGQLIEDDVHKSIKYSLWASTPNGNKKLNAGYQEAQEKSGDCRVHAVLYKFCASYSKDSFLRSLFNILV
ncbi:hypothetical protein IFM89_006822 [Coptis chinensis]|uniref:YTH domain-containing family protein n=1 Tax=Coptis chinensis TaxID=261450 RepID=A0A835M1V4_9MAGN|nr:hypothetical protein IFM89_006822 [Coptis chinensis]